MRQMLTIYWSRPGDACCKCWNMLGQSAPAKCWNNMFHTVVSLSEGLKRKTQCSVHPEACAFGLIAFTFHSQLFTLHIDIP